MVNYRDSLRITDFALVLQGVIKSLYMGNHGAIISAIEKANAHVVLITERHKSGRNFPPI